MKELKVGDVIKAEDYKVPIRCRKVAQLLNPIVIDKQETRVVYVYEKGVEIGKFVIVVNCNNHLVANRVKE